MKYCKKPLIVEAKQWRGEWSPEKKANPVCACGAIPGYYHVHTLEGPIALSLGDWIITGVKGEQYPCKPDVFEATYDLVEEVGHEAGNG